jgi:lipid-A-disaccharide synthase
MNREIVKELIQGELNRHTLKKELSCLLYDKEARGKMLKNYAELSEKLGRKGASEKTAKLMIHYLKG